MLSKLSIFIVLLIIPKFFYGQDEVQKLLKPANESANGNTYALIVGVSNYQDSAHINKLHYADKDAQEFYNVVMKSWGVDSNHVFVYLNENATVPNIAFKALPEILRKAKGGDKVYIYFAGHGDVWNQRVPYLLTYETNAQDPNHYYGTALEVPYLKENISMMVDNNIKVFLITDACRSGEATVVSNGTGIALEKTIEKNVGEILITACSNNQYSTEGKEWGGGHGLFSYFFTEGLKGYADKNNDHIITVGELMQFVKDSVAAVRLQTKVD